MEFLIQELVTLSIMAFAVSMDAFSVGLGLGLAPLKIKQVFRLGLTVGMFHVFLPLAGIFAGRILSDQLGFYTTQVCAVLLIAIGLEMFLGSFGRNRRKKMLFPKGIGMIMSALSVSMDSLPVGLTLGLFGSKTALAVLLFGFFSCILTWTGILFAKTMKGWFGHYSQAFGGSILFFLGLKLLLP